jgi:hypothetical protein
MSGWFIAASVLGSLGPRDTFEISCERLWKNPDRDRALEFSIARR